MMMYVALIEQMRRLTMRNDTTAVNRKRRRIFADLPAIERFTVE